MDWMLKLLNGGAGSLASYLAAHVLLCLLPAFFIAGAMAALIPKASITRWLGRNTPAYVSYPAAAVAGSLIAVCSCTIVPLFAGIYRKGAGIGPAITFLFFAPAGNIMALAYTGSILGAEFAVARLVLCLLFGIGIGLLMSLIFWRDDATHDAETDDAFADKAQIAPAALGVLLSLVALLIAGTLKLWPLTTTVGTVTLPLGWAQAWQDTLFSWVPFDAAKGEEGVSFQGSVLIALLLTIAATAWKGLDNITDGANRWTWVALGLAATTLLVAAARLTPVAGGLEFALTGRVLGVGLTLWAVWHYARQLPADDWQAWLWEAWRFVKQIFVVLVVGVFIVGMVRQVIRPEWIEAVAGSNTVLANAVAVGFGVFMYFPTLVEVPVARMFLDLGMHPGPLLAYLMADPELSLQSMLMVAAVIGRTKTAGYVSLVALFSTCAGFIYGSWMDGAVLQAVMMALGLFSFVVAASYFWSRARGAITPQA
ncbi:permease [Alicycliphilus denitrificans]|uniref:permease n=1 Tax=Alicycliphilus denitrificans TaxID=179636 RepID=UPI0001D9F283|nr:permease [Alicycliphilus denitrificans]ADV00440.1 permease [Alicycliphilus denitrificans BC]